MNETVPRVDPELVRVTLGAPLEALGRRAIGHVHRGRVDRHGHGEYPKEQPAANGTKCRRRRRSFHEPQCCPPA